VALRKGSLRISQFFSRIIIPSVIRTPLHLYSYRKDKSAKTLRCQTKKCFFVHRKAMERRSALTIFNCEITKHTGPCAAACTSSWLNIRNFNVNFPVSCLQEWDTVTTKNILGIKQPSMTPSFQNHIQNAIKLFLSSSVTVYCLRTWIPNNFSEMNLQQWCKRNCTSALNRLKLEVNLNSSYTQIHFVHHRKHILCPLQRKLFNAVQKSNSNFIWEPLHKGSK
jgi:hypothetical protein